MESLAEVAFDKDLEANGVVIILDEQITKIKPHVGEGGFGKVYKGTYVEGNTSHSVAIKKIKLEEDEPELKKKVYDDIMNEIKVIIKANHPSIPKFYGIYKKKGFYHLIFEFIEGKSLKNAYADMDKQTKLQVLRDSLVILKDFHTKKLIHRDIKPDNIMINKDNKPILIDFGVSKIAQKTCTFTTVQIGTAPYMAPEMYNVNEDEEINPDAKPIPISTYSDIWSFGCMISEIFSGIKPWNKKKDSPINDYYIAGCLATNKKFPIPNEIDDDVKKLIESALIYDIGERPSAELLHDLIEKLLNEK
jgi:non-specific serine/threonine protein kinase